MTKEQYLQKQQELRDKRSYALNSHREAIDEIERKHREKCAFEDECYRTAKRIQKDRYTRTYQAIEQEMMALKAEWYEAHPECPMKDWREPEEGTNAARSARQME